jgi:hypothetical protein
MNPKSLRLWGVSLVLVVVGVLCVFSQSSSQIHAPEDVRVQLRAIDYRHYKNLTEYLSKCEQIRGLLPSMESFYDWGDRELHRLRAKSQDNPQLVKSGYFIATLNALDEAGERLLRGEMDLALQMSKLPPNQQQAFFDENIRPIQELQDSISGREIELARKAKRDGMHLPEFMERNLGDSK